MIIYKDLTKIEQMPETCVALGYFDGIHAGHQALIERCVSDARERGVKAAVFTFSNSPKLALGQLGKANGEGKEEAPQALMTWDEKVRALSALGVDYLIAPAFDESIRSMSPEAFVRDLLVGTCSMTGAYCGFNYSFGRKAAGKAEDLRRMGEEGPERFTTFVQEPFMIDGCIVSSTVIRAFVGEGDMESANRFLGHRFSLEGEAVPGRRIGTGIGFPTANFYPDATLLTPPDGVYATKTEIDGTLWPSVTNIGRNPTVGGDKDDPRSRVETHLIGFPPAVLYGKHIRVFFAKRIRGEIRFEDIKALGAQIARDKEEALNYWNEQ